jgi:aspartate racemase
LSKQLGVLGGMGPLASAFFMQRITLLTQAQKDQDHIPIVLWSDPTIPDRATSIKGLGPDCLPLMKKGLNGLISAGCEAIVIPCNTAHYFYNELGQEISIPIIHIVDSVNEYLKKEKIKPCKVGLISTFTTRNFKIYDERMNKLGYEVLHPNDDEMNDLVMPAIDMVKGNDPKSAQKPFLKVADSLISQGAELVILGCTEIQIGINSGPIEVIDLPLIDSVDCLAYSAITWSKNHSYLL